MAKKSLLAALVLLAASASVGPASGAAEACADPVTLPGLGPACPEDGGYRVHLPGGAALFTHGPDLRASSHGPLDPYICSETWGGLGVNDQLPAPGPCATPVAPVCVGDTDPTQRIEVLYAHRAGTPDRSAAMAPVLRDMVERANGVVHAEAAGLGGSADLRVVCDGGVIRVASETVSDIDHVAVDLAARGYDSPHAKYWIWYDGSHSMYGGVSTLPRDDRLAADNDANRTTGYSIVYGVENYVLMLHELSHALGAVQRSAPHASPLGHCLDGQDVMCYDDRPLLLLKHAQNPTPTINVRQLVGDMTRNGPFNPAACPDREVFDCGHDDYFHPSPPSGSYLATHWNLASPLNGFIET